MRDENSNKIFVKIEARNIGACAYGLPEEVRQDHVIQEMLTFVIFLLRKCMGFSISVAKGFLVVGQIVVMCFLCSFEPERLLLKYSPEALRRPL